MDGDLSLLIAASQQGDAEARNQLLKLIMPTLRRIAAGYMRRERPNHTLEIDGIITDAFMEFVKLTRMEFNDRDHFFAQVRRFMKRRLEKYRKDIEAQKRPPRAGRISLDDSVLEACPFLPDLYDLRDAIERMAKEHPRQQQALVLHYFDGYRQREVAEKLGCSLPTIENYLRLAKTWLARELNS